MKLLITKTMSNQKPKTPKTTNTPVKKTCPVLPGAASLAKKYKAEIITRLVSMAKAHTGNVLPINRPVFLRSSTDGTGPDEYAFFMLESVETPPGKPTFTFRDADGSRWNDDLASCSVDELLNILSVAEKV